MITSKLHLDGIEIITVDTRIFSTKSPRGADRIGELLRLSARTLAVLLGTLSLFLARKGRRFTLRKLR